MVSKYESEIEIAVLIVHPTYKLVVNERIES